MDAIRPELLDIVVNYLDEGKNVAIIAPYGFGKTTFLKMLSKYVKSVYIEYPNNSKIFLEKLAHTKADNYMDLIELLKMRNKKFTILIDNFHIASKNVIFIVKELVSHYKFVIASEKDLPDDLKEFFVIIKINKPLYNRKFGKKTISSIFIYKRKSFFKILFYFSSFAYFLLSIRYYFLHRNFMLFIILSCFAYSLLFISRISRNLFGR